MEQEPQANSTTPPSDECARVRNFCIIAHIDHGKSTLADRLIDLTKAVSSRKRHDQHLDTMELEQERGITIKAQAIRMEYKSAQTGEESVFNLIDTPGHVDFNYEVSRSLAACEGAVLLVDATQGIEAQTISNAYLALEHDLEIIPVINKVDMAAAEPEKVMQALNQAFGIKEEEVLLISARTGQGVPELADAIQARIPPPGGSGEAPLKALVFDYKYDSFKGIVAYLRVVDGRLRRGERVKMMRSGKSFDATEIGFFNPEMEPREVLEAGGVGYVATGLKDMRDVRVGETLTAAAAPAAEPLPGYKPLQPVVFTGVYPVNSERYQDLKDAMAKLQLNDAALFFDPESSAALGFGLRCGFLGLLHMEIVQERLEREYGLEVITTSPSVKYEVKLNDGTELTVDNPSKMPKPERIASIAEPWASVRLLAPLSYFGAISELVQERRGQFGETEYLQGAEGGPNSQRIMLNCHIPLSEMLVGFHDKLKSATSGYGSMDYELSGYRPAKMVKLDVLVNQQVVDALCALIDKSRAESKAREIASYLKEFIPRQMFEVPIQVAIGGRVLARENIKALRKNVLAKCYGGDVTRKRKLLEKQAKGKKRMKKIGRVDVPQEAFMAVLKLNS